ncbi:6896_t:CDS:2 [Dentiscutata heterogama]|uniref:6896_t:CDS:1 n=1 Tax=Dentiscutata heterogama TaxID=1316150 RepID=A0ACA9K594_9GLOM|nr:6896_t:CDS:2 [Dentiscutata heterogama]
MQKLDEKSPNNSLYNQILIDFKPTFPPKITNDDLISKSNAFIIYRRVFNREISEFKHNISLEEISGKASESWRILHASPSIINGSTGQENNMDEESINGDSDSVSDTNFKSFLITRAHSAPITKNYDPLIKDLVISKSKKQSSYPYIIYKKTSIKTARNNGYNSKMTTVHKKNKNKNLSRNEITFESLIKETRKNKGNKDECNTFNDKIETLLEEYNIRKVKFSQSQINNRQLIGRGGSANVYSVDLQGEKWALKSFDLNIKWDVKNFKIFLKEREEMIPGTPQGYANLYMKCWSSDPENRPKLDSILCDLERLSTETAVKFIINASNKSSE